MSHFSKSFARGATDGINNRNTIFANPLKFPKFPHKGVIRFISNFRCVGFVIELLMISNQLSKLVYSFGIFSFVFSHIGGIQLSNYNPKKLIGPGRLELDGNLTLDGVDGIKLVTRAVITAREYGRTDSTSGAIYGR